MVDPKQARWVQDRVARNFWGSLFLRIGDFFSVLQKLILKNRTHWFFSLRINFCDFQKVHSTFPVTENERKNEQGTSTQH